MRWHNGLTRRCQTRTRKKSKTTDHLNGTAAQRIPSWPGASHSNKGRIHLRRPTRHFTFRLRQGGRPYIPGGDSNLYVANAGHPPVLLRRKEQERWERIELQDMRDFADLPLGMFRNTYYQQVSLPLGPGDRLALYTDGLTEGTDSREQEFGEDCLRASLRKHGHVDLASLKNKLVNDLRLHVGGPFAHDDVTLLLVEVLGNSRPQCQ